MFTDYFEFEVQFLVEIKDLIDMYFEFVKDEKSSELIDKTKHNYNEKQMKYLKKNTFLPILFSLCFQCIDDVSLTKYVDDNIFPANLLVGGTPMSKMLANFVIDDLNDTMLKYYS